MDADLYKSAIEYELLTRTIYEEILKKEGVTNVEVKHNGSLRGRSGVEHQIDVYWGFKQAGVPHRVIIECKDYASSITLEKVRNFFAVVHDVGKCIGIMVTKTGYQKGAAAFAAHYGLQLKLLRQPVDEDWKGRIKQVGINIIARSAVSTTERPIKCQLNLGADGDQFARLQAAVTDHPELLQNDPTTRLLGMDGEPITDELMWWLPRQLDVLKLKDGGPYTQEISLKDHYIALDLGQGPELVRLLGLKVEFHVESTESRVIVDAADIVTSILKDFSTGDIEHVLRKS